MGDRRELRITIEFYSDGTTVANMWKHRLGGGLIGALHLKHGEAKCHPDDKFDPQIGAMIALARMFGDEVEFKSEKEEPKKLERKLTDVEKMALKKGYTLVKDRLPSCKAYDGKYTVMTGEGCEGDGLYWSHKYKTFSVRDIDNRPGITDDGGKEAYRVWMSGKHGLPVVAWKVQPDKVEQKALDEGYTLCRDRYPDKPGGYDVTTEDGAFWHNLSWNGDHFGNTAKLWMNKRENPAIAWKEYK